MALGCQFAHVLPLGCHRIRPLPSSGLTAVGLSEVRPRKDHVEMHLSSWLVLKLRSPSVPSSLKEGIYRQKRDVLSLLNSKLS